MKDKKEKFVHGEGSYLKEFSMPVSGPGFSCSMLVVEEYDGSCYVYGKIDGSYQEKKSDGSVVTSYEPITSFGSLESKAYTDAVRRTLKREFPDDCCLSNAEIL